MGQPDRHVLEKILEEVAFLESLLQDVVCRPHTRRVRAWLLYAVL